MTNNIFYKTYAPNKFLQPYISRIFVFECKSGISRNDFSLIAPTGEMKLVIPYRNNMRSIIGKTFREHKESSCFFIGLHTQAALIECDMDYGNVCVTFKPFGIYKFFNFPLRELAGQIHNASDVFNKLGKELQERVAEIMDVDKKVLFVQEFLYQQMVSIQRSDPVTEYAINKIISREGLISITELSEEMGYSRRYLVSKFTENLGISPKEFSCIVRFNEVYKKINLNRFSEDTLYNLYYDQSHYIKEFKKFTGFTPGEYVSQSNKLGSIFFNE
ncbi:MAG: AraC family transcriptional regulator [Clostridia bacterium]|nr:AraC family transcriptional regulator [Clostridia bacterium]